MFVDGVSSAAAVLQALLLPYKSIGHRWDLLWQQHLHLGGFLLSCWGWGHFLMLLCLKGLV